MIRHLRRLITVLAVLATLPAALMAQSEGQPRFTLESDRPGLGDGAHVMAPGVWQTEFGGQYMSGPAARFSVGQGLLRGGFEPFELRIYVNSLVIDQSDANSDFGFEDLGLGVKVPVMGSAGWNWAALGLLTFPTGSDEYSAREVTGGGSVIGETTLFGSVGLALNGGYFFPFDGIADGQFVVIVTPTFPIPGAPAISGYLGTASYIGRGPDQNFIEAGLAYASNADTQLDLNWGIDTDSREWFLGVGWARRWR